MRALGLIAALWLGLYAGAAGADPYGDWTFNAEKAEKANDLEALGALTDAQPHFGRIWFYGQVFDLVNEGVPQATRDAVRPRLVAIARRLGAQTPPDPTPLMYLDRVDSGALAAQAPVARALQEAAIGAVGAGTPVGAAMATIERPELAQWAFYTLFDRAWRARKRLGGARDVAGYLKVARRMAEGYALAHGDLGPLQALLAWHGPTGLPQERLILETELDRALLALNANTLPEAARLMEATLALARSTQGDGLITALVLNGVAHVAGRQGDRAREAALRVQVLQAVRPLGKPALVALAASQVTATHAAAGDVGALLPYAKELRALGAPTLEVAQHLRTLHAAQIALTTGARSASAAGDFVRADAALTEAAAIAQALAQRETVARLVPAAAVDAELATRQMTLAGLQQEAGHLARRRGLFTDAEAAYAAAAATWAEGLQRTDRVADLAADRATLALDMGDLSAALDHARVALAHAGGDDVAVVKARAYAAQAKVRLRQGAWAPAFANANQGLQVLRDAGAADAQGPLRAALHTTAGVVLHAVGYTVEGTARLRQAAGLTPRSVPAARTLALALLDANDIDGALAALAPALEGPNGRSARVLQGCVLTLAGRTDEALPLLEAAKGMTLPHLRDARLSGLACLAHALLAKGDTTGAERALAPIRVLAANPKTDPAIAWRLLALDGRIALARKVPLTAGRRWQQAMARHAELAQARAARGVTLDTRWLAAPAQPDQLLADGPSVLAAAAAKAPAKEQSGLHRAAIALSLYGRALAAAPVGGALSEGGLRPAEAEADFRAAVARLADLRARLTDPLIQANDRARLLQAEQAAVVAIGDGRAAMLSRAPGWTDYLAPSLPTTAQLNPAADEARLYYHVAAERSHLWLVVGGQPVRHYALPGEAALAKGLEPALKALKTPPLPWPASEGNTRRRAPKDPNLEAWALLQAPVPRVLPFLRDKAASAAIQGKALRVFPDGPLVRLPFDGLVLAPPPKGAVGAPPEFLGARHAIRVSLSVQRAPKRPEAAHALAAFGPLTAGAGCPKGPGALDLCGAPDQAAESQEITAAFAVAPDGFHHVTEAAATAEGLAAAMASHRTTWLLSPVDLAGGAILTSPAAAGQPYPRAADKALGVGAAVGSAAVVLSRTSAPAPGDAVGLRRLVAALRARGVQAVLVNTLRAGVDPERAGALAARLAQGEALVDAARAQAAADRAAVVDPVAGGAPKHHPYVWGRGLLID